jgi:hypothetical protein
MPPDSTEIAGKPETDLGMPRIKDLTLVAVLDPVGVPTPCLHSNDLMLAWLDDALQMALVVLTVGVLLGILAGTEMSAGMAHALIDPCPPARPRCCT